MMLSQVQKWEETASKFTHLNAVFFFYQAKKRNAVFFHLIDTTRAGWLCSHAL